MNLKNTVDEYIQRREADDISETTKEIYRIYLNELVDFLGEISLERFNKENVEAFLDYQRNREGQHGKLSDSTIEKYYHVINTFSNWLEDRGYKRKSVTYTIKAPTVQKELPEILSSEEVYRFLKDLEENTDFHTRKLFRFILNTGARLSEVVTLDLGDIELENEYVKLSYQGRQEPVFLYYQVLIQDLNAYLEQYRNVVARKGESAFFVTRKGTRYTKEGLSTIIRRKLNKIGVKGKCGINKLRNTFAVQFLIQGGKDYALLNILGLKSMRSVEPYIKLAGKFKSH